MLRSSGGELRRSISAAVALAAVALSASCTSGSSGGSPHAGGSSSPSPSSTVSADTLADDSLVTLPATAVVQVGSSSSTSTLRTSAGQPLQLEVSPSGAVSVTLAMRGSGAEAFSVEGPAKTGTALTNEHVVIFLSSGILIDTVQGNPCTATYDVLTQSHVSATFRCLTREGAAKVPVTVRLTAGH